MRQRSLFQWISSDCICNALQCSLAWISEGMKWEQLYCCGHDLPCPHDAVHPRIFMFYHCYSRWRWDRVKHPQPPDENKDTNVSRMARAPPRRSGSFCSWTINKTGNCYLQQLVTAKLLATSRLSMWGVSLNSEVPNWTIPIRNALYSWSAPLGNRPPVIDSSRASFSIVKYIKTLNGLSSLSCKIWLLLSSLIYTY